MKTWSKLSRESGKNSPPHPPHKRVAPDSQGRRETAMANKAESWLPLPFKQFSQEVDRLFDELIHRPWGARGPGEEWSPQLDLYETESAFILEADLPGVKKQDVSVAVEDGNLVLQGRRSAEGSRSEGSFHY